MTNAVPRQHTTTWFASIKVEERESTEADASLFRPEWEAQWQDNGCWLINIPTMPGVEHLDLAFRLECGLMAYVEIEGV